jgi:hypothetical protein
MICIFCNIPLLFNDEETYLLCKKCYAEYYNKYNKYGSIISYMNNYIICITHSVEVYEIDKIWICKRGKLIFKTSLDIALKPNFKNRLEKLKLFL